MTDDIPECIRRDANNRAPFMGVNVSWGCAHSPSGYCNSAGCSAGRACVLNRAAVTARASEEPTHIDAAWDAYEASQPSLAASPQASFPWELPPSLAKSGPPDA